MNDSIKLLEQFRNKKDMDEIAKTFMDIITLYGLRMDEVAALNYYIVERAIKAKHNAEFLKNKLDLDVNSLGVEGILKVQEALVNVYVDKLSKKI